MSNSHQQQPQQRVFSESDETQLLKTFRKVSKSSSTTSCNSPSSPSSSFTITSQHLDLIEASLGLRFSHTQIIDKLRRLKLKYHRQARSKSLIRTPHDLRLHNISRKIWGRRSNPTTYASKHVVLHRQEEEKIEEKEEEEGEEEEAAAVVGLGLEDFPFLREEFSRVFPGNGIWEKGLVRLGGEKMRGFNEEWMLVKKEEAELIARRAELEKELIRLVVQAFGSSSPSTTEL